MNINRPVYECETEAPAFACPALADFAELQVLQYQIATIGAAAAAPKPRTSATTGSHAAAAAAALAAAAASPPPAARPRSAAVVSPPQAKAPTTPPRSRVRAPGMEVMHASFGFDSLSAIGAGTPRLPEGLAAAAASYEACDEDALAVSVGQISLNESLGHRAVLLRRELSAQLGPGLLAQAFTALAQAEAAGGMAGGGDVALRQRVATLLGPKWSDDVWPLLEELQFLDSRRNKGK